MLLSRGAVCWLSVFCPSSSNLFSTCSVPWEVDPNRLLLWVPLPSGFCWVQPMVGTSRRLGWEEGDVAGRSPSQEIMSCRSSRQLRCCSPRALHYSCWCPSTLLPSLRRVPLFTPYPSTDLVLYPCLLGTHTVHHTGSERP